MQIINGENQSCSDRTTSEYLTVNSCGFYEIGEKDIKTCRPHGRSDYQLIYVADGRTEYLKGGEYNAAVSGDLILYRPKETQDYCFCGGCETKVYWIHFTGTGVCELLREAGFSDEMHYHIGDGEWMKKCVAVLAREIQLAKPGYGLFCRAELVSAIASASRAINALTCMQKTNKYEKLIPIIEKMNLCMHDSEKIGDYARKCCMDKYYFISLFKEYTGLSPHAYRTRIKMERAKELLADTSMTNGEIAELLGYKDPLYFSRAFKKYAGKSPNAYRKYTEL